MPAINVVPPRLETADSILSGSPTMSPQFIDIGIYTDEIDSSRTIGILGKRIAIFECLERVILRAISEAVLAFAVDFW